MPLTMMLDGEVRTRVSESLAESQLRAAPEPASHPRTLLLVVQKPQKTQSIIPIDVY